MSGNWSAQLSVSKGPEAGTSFAVPPQGARLGRSSKNDLMLSDPLLSRHHCRVFFKPDRSLWVTDLGSANQTMVNGQQIQESPLQYGDTVQIGDTEIKVMEPVAAPLVPEAAGPAIDLGLSSASAHEPAFQWKRTGLLMAVAGVAILAAIGIWLPKLRRADPQRPAPPPAPEPTLTVSYEKVQASPRNVFRYNLMLNAGRLTIEIDDLENNRHVRKDTEVDADLVRNLTRTVRDSGFFNLNEEYQGVQPDIHDQWDIGITLGRRAHRVRVLNRVEPDVFQSVRQTLEAFGKNELGLWAIQFSAEKLSEMAESAYLLGKKLRDEREIKFGNLAGAIKSLTEAEWYLETVEVKPAFHTELRGLVGECEQMLADRHNDQNFLAERAIRLRDWNQAARELRVLIEMIPDRSDVRNQEARKKLLDVEARLAAQR